MTKKSISNPKIFEVLDKGTHQTYYGCDQRWYTTEWQRLSGCGPSVATNIIFYLNHVQFTFGLDKEKNSKNKCLELMEEIWEYVTPTRQGIPTTKMFYEAVLTYSKAKEIDVEYSFLNVPEEQSLRPQLTEILHFIEEALLKDVP